ncbi:hypothetical protein [Streptomyces sp. NPDC012508]|uniref:hypothetical protein n=1 Tax=Streptomyces sp. NPDC012508 TaxID=3364837 RepID=UPI0036AE48B4
MKNDDIPLVPDAAWLEERLGVGSLWRPDEAALPAELTDTESRKFLLTVGFPAVRLGIVGIETRHLRGRGGMEPFDADEIYGRRYPDDDSPPTDFCFTVAMRGDQHLMLDAADGSITHYDPNGWDHGAGWQGPAAENLPTLALLLGMIAESSNALESTDDAVRRTALADLRALMIDWEPYTGDSAFWSSVFKSLD